MHQQERSMLSAIRQLSVKGKTTFMPIGNSMPFSENSNDDNITRLCVQRTN
jgi:hypothetical protein